MKFILYYKEPYIVKEPLTKNRTCQTWRGKQLWGCDERKPLEDYIERQSRPEDYYIEEQPHP